MVRHKLLKYSCFKHLLNRWLLAFAFFIAAPSAQATHIVGGDMTYRHISGNTYIVTLNLFIDCDKGNPQAIASDQFAIFGVFNSAGTLVQRWQVPRNSPIRVEKLNYRCATNKPNQCVDHYIYNQEITLPDAGEYTIAFQRCCRNNSILNLVDPGGTGATYWTKIPAQGITGVNSSPVFDSIPPNFLCTSAPFSFFHTATDPDGDSLVYELYRPYDGGDDQQTSGPLSPRPDPPLGPPYNNVAWKTPFNTNNMMAGAPILTYDSKTGELYVVPNTIGQFVVAFKVKEYRDGVLIGETLRDIQFNVLNCNFQVVSNFDYTLDCDNKLTFNNKSYSSNVNDPPNFEWNLGLPGKSDESTVKDFEFSNAPGGVIYARLVATNTQCTDTFTRRINVPEVLKLTLTPPDEICDGENKIFYAETNVNTTKKWHDNSSLSSYFADETENISVEVTDARGCKETAFTSLLVKPNPVPTLGDGQNICDPFSVTLDAGNLGAKYKWNTGQNSKEIVVNKTGVYIVEVDLNGCIIKDTIIYSDTQRVVNLGPDSLYCEPIVFTIDAGPGFENYIWHDETSEQTYLVDTTGLYFVEVEDEFGCRGSDTLNVRIVPFYDFDIGDGENICKDEFYRFVDAHREENTGATYQWNTGPNDTLSFLEIKKPGVYWVDVRMDLCVKRDSIIYHDTSFVFELADLDNICSDDTAVTFDPGDYVTYLWQDGSTDRTYITDTTELVQVQVTDTVECIGNGEFDLVINKLPHTGFGGQDTVICVAEDLFLDAGPGFVDYLWHDGTKGRTLSTRDEGPNYVTLTDTNGCVNTDTIYVSISENARNNNLFIPNAFSPNGDGLNDVFPYDFAIEDRYDFNLKIFTRWGEKVFDSSDPTKLWDGTVRDEWKYANTFIYIMQWRACDGKLELKKGIVMVLR